MDALDSRMRKHVDTYIELTKHVAGRQGHFVQVCWIPGTHNDTTIFRTILDLLNAFSQLVDALSRVVSVHVNVFGTKVPPLKAVHGS